MNGTCHKSNSTIKITLICSLPEILAICLQIEETRHRNSKVRVSPFRTTARINQCNRMTKRREKTTDFMGANQRQTVKNPLHQETQQPSCNVIIQEF